MATKEQEIESEHKAMLMAVHNDFRQQLKAFRRDGKFADLLVTCDTVDGQKMAFHVHKVVVCSASLFFHDLLKDDTSTYKEINLDFPVNSKVLEVLVDFMYTADLRLRRVPHSEIKTIPWVAKKLGIYSMGNVFIIGLINMINHDSLPVVMEMQSKLKSRYLHHAILKFIIAHLSHVKSSTIGLLTLRDLHDVLATASDLSTPVNVLLQSALKWVTESPAQRSKVLPKILAKINFESLAGDVVNSMLEDDVTMAKYPTLKERLYVAKQKAHCTSLPNLEVPNPPLSPATPHKQPCSGKAHTLLMYSGPTYSSSGIMMADTIFMPAPSNQRHFNGPGFVLIGRDEANRASIMFRSMTDNVWSAIEDLELSLEYKQGLAFWDNCVFFVGGEDVQATQCVVRDLVAKETKKLPHLQIKRASPVVAIHYGIIYAIGGIGRFGSALSHVECLDGVNASEWQNAPPLHNKRNDEASCCIYQDTIYIIGGGTNKCECFDRKRQCWQEVPSLPSEFSDFMPMTAVAADKLFAFSYYKPQVIFWLDTPGQAWIPIPTSGNGPEWIIQAIGVDKEIIAIEKSRWIYTCHVPTSYWMKSLKVPRVMHHTAHIASVLQ